MSATSSGRAPRRSRRELEAEVGRLTVRVTELELEVEAWRRKARRRKSRLAAARAQAEDALAVAAAVVTGARHRPTHESPVDHLPPTSRGPRPSRVDGPPLLVVVPPGEVADGR